MKRRTSQPASWRALVGCGLPGRRSGWLWASQESVSTTTFCCWPGEVVALGVDAVLGVGLRQVVAPADRQEAVLHHRLGHRGFGQQVLQRLRRAASEGVLDRLGVIEAAEHRLPQRSRQLVVVQDVREVGERPRRAGHRDAAVDGAVLRREPRAMRRDLRVPPTVPRRHLRPEQLTEANAPEGRRAAMTQHRPLTARQDRRQPPRLLPQAEVADGVHAAVDPVQPPRRQRVVDRVGCPIASCRRATTPY